MQKTERILGNIILLFVTLFLFCFSLEIFLRIFYPQDLNYFQLDDSLGYKGIPNIETTFKSSEFNTIVKLNKEGLRDYDYGNKEKHRILILGDSMTFGYGVENDETYSRVLENLLNKLEASYETINAGITGYDTSQELVFLENEGLKYKPDLVILGFMLNDIPTNYLNENIFSFNGSLVKKTQPYYKFSLSKKIRNFLSSKSHLYNFLKVKTGVQKRKTKEQEEKTVLVIKTFLGIENEEINKGWEKTFLLIKEMEKILNDREINFLIVIFPTKWQVDDNELKELINEYSIKEKINTTKWQITLSENLKKENIKYLNLLEEFRKANKDNDFYFEEGHFNRKGHEFVARLIYQKLIEEKLI